MRVLVCGGRDLKNVAFVYSRLDALHAERPFTHFIQGGAKGADAIAREWAIHKPGIELYICKAEWEKYGKEAGGRRNSRMLEWKPDLVVAFPTPNSRGTWVMIRKARAAGVETLVVE